MATNKTWKDLTKELSESFRKWKIPAWDLTPEKEPQRRNRIHTPDQLLVKVHWLNKNIRWINLVCSSEDTAHANLQLLVLTVESLRMDEVRKINRLVAGAYGLIYPPAALTPQPAALNKDDPYTVLGVAPSYSLAIIETIWKARLRAEHPDVGGTLARAQQLNAAMDAIRRLRS